MSLKEIMESEEGKAELEQVFGEWIKEKGYKAPQEVEGLVKKKDELLSKIANLNRERTSEEQRKILEALTELGVDSADDIKTALSKDKKGGDDFERQLKRLQQQAEEHKSLYEREHKQRLDMAKEATITRALKDAGIKDTAFDLAYSYFKDKADIEESDGKINIIARDPDGLGPSIDNFIADWAKSDKAKDYIQRPVNVGAGVAGSQDNNKKTTYKRSELSDIKLAKSIMERKRAGENITIED